MTYEIDPELLPIMSARAKLLAGVPVPERGDWKAIRENVAAGFAYISSLMPPTSDISHATHSMAVADGSEIELRWYTKEDSAPGSAVVYAHGGGMIAGDVGLYDAIVASYVSVTGVPFLSVDYRLAPEVQGSTLAEDVFAGLLWLIEHASDLGVDPHRIAVMGDSGGGGPAAGAAILARDRGVQLRRQILVYPMLDDRNTVPGALPLDVLTWTYDNNFTGWNALLGDELGAPTVSPIAAPARLTDFAGLAPAYVDVGDLDIFRDEDIAYAQNLARAGVPVELHVHAGAPHGFERFAPNTRLARQAMSDRERVVASL